MGTSLTATGVQFPDNSVQTAPALTGFRNRIINGDMKISQRGTSFPAANGYTLDRFVYGFGGTTAVATVTQSTDVPTGSGLSNSLRATVTTADTTIVGSDYALIRHSIEGYNVADLVGVPITLSFWVRSSKTGIHCVKVRNSSTDRAYVAEYTINTNNTWEKKYITISSGIPNDGIWDFVNGAGLLVNWALAVGSTNHTSTPDVWINTTNPLSTSNQVNCLDTVGNIFAITGVQLEKGSTPTEFEFRPYSVELALCQRYYEILPIGLTVGSVSAAGQVIGIRATFKVTKRVAATIAFVSELSSTGFASGAASYGFPDTDSVIAYKSSTSASTNANFYQTISISAEL